MTKGLISLQKYAGKYQWWKKKTNHPSIYLRNVKDTKVIFFIVYNYDNNSISKLFTDLIIWNACTNSTLFSLISIWCSKQEWNKYRNLNRKIDIT